VAAALTAAGVVSVVAPREPQAVRLVVADTGAVGMVEALEEVEAKAAVVRVAAARAAAAWVAVVMAAAVRAAAVRAAAKLGAEAARVASKLRSRPRRCQRCPYTIRYSYDCQEYMRP